jgi:hypothetical protein
MLPVDEMAAIAIVSWLKRCTIFSLPTRDFRFLADRAAEEEVFTLEYGPQLDEGLGVTVPGTCKNQTFIKMHSSFLFSFFFFFFLLPKSSADNLLATTASVLVRRRGQPN